MCGGRITMRLGKFKLFVLFSIVLTMLIPTQFVVGHAETSTLNVMFREENENVLTVYGSTASSNQGIFVFLLKEGYSPEDVADITDTAALNDSCAFFDMIFSDSDGNFSADVGIPDDKTYTLYIKSGNETYVKVLERAQDLKIYVSPDATGEETGTIDKPFATIEAARDYLRTIPYKGQVDVVLLGGTYRFDKTIEFTKEDSGSELAPIRYIAAEGETVVFSGIKQLDTNKINLVSNDTIRNRLKREVENNVVEIDLKEQSVDISKLDFISKYMSAYYEMGDYLKPFKLYFNGEKQRVSRWPNDGYARFTKFVSGDAYTTSGSIAENAGTIYCDTDDINRWTGQSGFFVEGYLGYQYRGEWVQVKNVDVTNKALNLAYYSYYGIGKSIDEGNVTSMRWSVVNLPEEIDVPGEWYYDNSTDIIYLYLPDELSSTDKFEIATFDKDFIKVNNAEFIQFVNLNFEKNASFTSIMGSGNDGNGISINESDNIGIIGCNFNDIGANAIQSTLSTNTVIDGCVINDVGYSGINIGDGDSVNMTPSGTIIKNCDISGVMQYSANNGRAGIKVSGSGTTIKNNLLHDMKNSAIRFSGTKHIIEYNEIYNCVTESADAGAIYAGRSWSEYGNEIRYNYFHDVGMQEKMGYECASAVFLDDFFSGTKVYGNIMNMNNMYSGMAIKVNGGTDNEIYGNIIMNSYVPVKLNRLSLPSNYTSDGKYTNLKSALEANPALATDFAGMKTNYDNLTAGNYKPNCTLLGNVYYNCNNSYDIDWNYQLYSSATIKNNGSCAIDDFVDYNNGKYMIKSSTKTAKNLHEAMPDENFDITLIGIQNGVDVAYDLHIDFPGNGTKDVDTKNISIGWNKVETIDEYFYEIKSENGSVVESGKTKNNFLKVSSALMPGTKYTFSVDAIKNGVTICENNVTFSTLTGFGIKNASLRNGEIIYDVYNYTGAPVTFYELLAHKDCYIDTETLINAHVGIQKTSANNTYETDSIECPYEIEDSKEYINLYIWKSLESLTPLTEELTFK